MSADLLKRAATKLRETADAATPSPWATRVRHGGSLATIISNDPGLRTHRHGPKVVVHATATTRGSAENLTYCALMQPSVAGPLADLLDEMAASYERFPVDAPMVLRAFTVARALLSETEVTA